MSCDCKCSVSLPHTARVCDCGISYFFKMSDIGPVK